MSTRSASDDGKAMCSFCGGTGTMREVVRYTTRKIKDNKTIERSTVPGETCPMCFG